VLLRRVPSGDNKHVMKIDTMQYAEGSSARIYHRGEWVHKRGRSSNIYMPIDEQYRLHYSIYTILTQITATGYKKYRVLCTPYPIYVSEREYAMERIDDSHPIQRDELSDELVHELKELYRDLMMRGIFPHDYELYLQDNGEVALIDYDKFGTYTADGCIKLSYGDKIYSVRELLVSALLPDGFHAELSCVM
jgi:hypothetical protein